MCQLDDEETIIDFEEEQPSLFKPICFMIFTILSIFALLVLSLCLTSCTLSLQTINTSGTATDLVDDEQKPQNTVSPTLNIPVKPL